MRTSVGVSINVPLQWGRRKAELDGARAAYRKAEWTLADAKATVLAELVQAYARLEQASRSVTLHKNRLLPVADATLSAALSSYRNGKGDFLALIAAKPTKFEQQLNLERSFADQYRALAGLEEGGRRIAC